MQAKIFEVEDGDTITILAKVPVGAFDPAQQIKAVARAYRVVATSGGPLLKLVELQKEPVRMMSEQMEDIKNAFPGARAGYDHA